ncbi:MAG: LLM class flavin-dependent oxidoreductase [Acidimicrobiales bacterium]
MDRLGMTVPVNGLALKDQVDISRSLENLGFTDLWSSEAMSSDAFTPLALASSSPAHARLGTAIASVYARGPACLAQTVATLDAAAPGRIAIGIGSSSKLIVEEWMDRPFSKPLQRTLDTVRF